MPKKKAAGSAKKKSAAGKKDAPAADAGAAEALGKFSAGYSSRCRIAPEQTPIPSVEAEIIAAVKGATPYEILLFDQCDLVGPLGSSRLEPLLLALRETAYPSIKQMHFWKTPVSNMDAMVLASYLEQRADASELEFLDNDMTHFAAGRIGGALGFNQKITSLTIKHNLFGDAGVRELCRGLAMNQTLTKLTLDYCDIGPDGAEALGQGAATNASWTELSLNGNHIGSKGLLHLARGLSENVTLKLLSLQDNGIDTFEKEVNCLDAFKAMGEVLAKNDTLSQLDLLGNVIGDAGGAAVLALYEQRKAQKLPALNIRVSHRMSKALFDSIAKATKWGSGGAAGGAKGKKKGGKKKGKKKK